MQTLLALGSTSTHFRDRVSTILKRERDNIIRRYWPDPQAFLDILSESRAIVTGEAALSFFMRDPDLLTDELEVCVSFRDSFDLLDRFEWDLLVTRTCSWENWPVREL